VTIVATIDDSEAARAIWFGSLMENICNVSSRDSCLTIGNIHMRIFIEMLSKKPHTDLSMYIARAICLILVASFSISCLCVTMTQSGVVTRILLMLATDERRNDEDEVRNPTL